MRLPLQMAAVVLSLFAVAEPRAETLPLPADLVALPSEQGEALLFGAEARSDFVPLSAQFVTQVNPAFCGPATIAMVLNALELPRPPSEATLGLGLFDQDNVFSAAAEAAKPRAEGAPEMPNGLCRLTCRQIPRTALHRV